MLVLDRCLELVCVVVIIVPFLTRISCSCMCSSDSPVLNVAAKSFGFGVVFVVNLRRTCGAGCA
eukprot:586699-Amphidinium_carterae.1